MLLLGVVVLEEHREEVTADRVAGSLVQTRKGVEGLVVLARHWHVQARRGQVRVVDVVVDEELLVLRASKRLGLWLPKHILRLSEILLEVDTALRGCTRRLSFGLRPTTFTALLFRIRCETHFSVKIIIR